MAGRFLLDTNVVIALLNGDTSVTGRLAQADEVFVSIIVLGELYFGAHKSERVDENIAHINEFAATSAVLGCDTNTADHYGLVNIGCEGGEDPFQKTIFGLQRLRSSIA